MRIYGQGTQGRGRVLKGARIERLHVRADDRGGVFAPFPDRSPAAGAIGNIHVATLRPGAVRGNHRHTAQTEYICCCGPIRLVLQDEAGRRERVEFDRGECVRITVKPGIAHAVVNTGAADTFIVCASRGPRRGDRQVHVPLISEIGHT
jgi:dTDP-4-dehydrorhamnose 3,5-epimerase-like enzyme